MSTETRKEKVEFVKAVILKGKVYSKRLCLVLAIFSGMIFCSGVFPEIAQTIIRVASGTTVCAVSLFIAWFWEFLRMKMRKRFDEEGLNLDEFCERFVDGKYDDELKF